jgi:VanZ family protein
MSRLVSRSVLVPSGMAVVSVFFSFLPSHTKAVFHTQGRFHLWGHLSAFCAATFFSVRCVKSNRTSLRLVFGAFLLGIAIELIQHLIYPGETFEPKDVLFDSLGILLGAALGHSRSGSNAS